MEVKTDSPIVTEKVKNQVYLINYGNLNKGERTDVKIKVLDCNYLTHKQTCTCTKPSIEIQENGFDALIQYDSNKLGVINQYAEITTDKGKIRIELTGKVI